jgi:mannose-6-phosphate isomerase-like protein (cupin superfamily)
MTVSAIDLKDKLGMFSEHWQPHIVAQLNDYHVKIAKMQGDFVWHSHPETDELFLVLEGELRIDFRDGAVALKAGEMCVVPMGVEHKPFAEAECAILMIEPAGTLNTGDAGGERTVEAPRWI